MKTSIKTGIAAICFLFAMSCTKEKVTTTSLSTGSSDDAKVIGQSFHGGIIFYIDKTGRHGLIVSTNDLGTTNVAWQPGSNKVTGATGTAYGTGASNTAAIVAALGKTGNYAALLCDNYAVGTYTNWYLPSKDELNLLYAQRTVIGNLSSSNYWSSSEVSKGKAWDQEFGGGFQFKDYKTFTLMVRAVSSF